MEAREEPALESSLLLGLIVLASSLVDGPQPTFLSIESPSDGSVLSTRQPTVRVCAFGLWGPSLEVTLDGEAITQGLTWSGECAQWSPAEGWTGWDARHAWSDPPYEEEGWLPGLRDGGHELVASVALASGERIAVTSRFRVETRRRTASLGLGALDVSLDGFDGALAPTRLLEARFGSRRASTLLGNAAVLRYTDKAFSLGGISTRLGSEGGPGETETSLWRFAMGRRKGYGYRTGDVTFVAPYHGTSAFVGDVDAYDGPFTPADTIAFHPFEAGLRVGTAFEGGFAFALGPSITLDAGYEATAVYPHWVFWEALGSGAVHGLALHVADGVSRQVAVRAPRAAPVVSFLLRNTISYAIFHQRRSEVNWPFGGV